MTAPTPDPGLRDQLAEALRAGWRDGKPFVVSEAEGSATRMDFGRYADALLPVAAAHVERIARERVAGILTRVKALPVYEVKDDDDLLGYVLIAQDVLDALRGQA